MTRVTSARINRLAGRLLAWFGQHARDLPWRRTRDPYAIWISEIMLQQTQVKTVIPYWERWMKALPTVRALARARPEKVLKLWEGLGYYRRARHLREAARIVSSRFGGAFPQAFDQVLQLPGVGRYTAGAICSIAFNQPTPILDGNVIRVLTRLFGIDRSVEEPSTKKQLWSLAEKLVAAAHRSESNTPARPACSRLNQSLMELGAIVCTPADPRCPACPVRGSCAAHRSGRIASLPVLPRQAPATPRAFLAVVLDHDDKLLVRRRPANEVNGGLWEFPNIERVTARNQESSAWLERWSTPRRSRTKLITVKHSITRYRMTVEAYALPVSDPSALPRHDGQWIKTRRVKSLAFTSAHRKILKAYLAARKEMRDEPESKEG